MAKRARFTRSVRAVPAGGPATVNGVVYQMLWSLLQAARLHVRTLNEPDAQSYASATLVLEPRGGGGDLVLQTDRRRIIQQVKARPDGQAWSLRSVLEEVIPDLYLAADGGGESRFQFITEGSIGDWEEVYKYFRSLGGRISPETDPSEVLDAAKELTFGRRSAKDGSDSFWGDGPYSEQRLFDLIVAVVRGRAAVSEREDEATTGRKLLQLLATFEFVGGQTQGLVQREIDACLRTLVDQRDELDRIRNALAFDLARRATQGDASVEAASFLADNGLSGLPLNCWATLRPRAKDDVAAFLEVKGYTPESDVRRTIAESVVTGWPADSVAALLTGESGQGKSWTAFALAQELLKQPALVVIVQAQHTADATLAEAARVVWQEIAGHDTALPLGRIANRIRNDAQVRLDPWLHLIIDGVQDSDSARELLERPWRKWCVRPILTCLPPIARSVARNHASQCHVVAVADFSIAELHRYLELHLGDTWSAIPGDVRGPLHRPLLAQLYVTSVTIRGASPTNEYGVYAAHWERASQAGHENGVGLRRLAKLVLEGAPYPLSGSQLAAAGICNAAFRDLERIGWLRRTPVAASDRYEFAHDRLLNWACAEALAEDLRERRVLAEAAGQTMRQCLGRALTASGRELGYVAMDALWLVLQDATLAHQAPYLIKQLDERLAAADSLYKYLLPTLGTSVLPALFQLIREHRTNSFRIHQLTGAVSDIGGPSAVAEATTLLGDDDPLNQRTAMEILGRCPSAAVLDRLWRLHCAGSIDPAPFLRDHDDKHFWYRDSFAALEKSVALNPSWLERRIVLADAEQEPLSDLAYLLACLPEDTGSEIWERTKRHLFENVPEANARALAQCIDRFSDCDETPWLVAQLSRGSNLVGPTALRALARLNGGVALAEIGRLPRRELALTRRWCLSHLFASHTEALRAKLLEMMQSDDEPWTTAEAYRERGHLLDEPTLDLLLDDLEQRLADRLAVLSWGNDEPLYRALSLLAQPCEAELLRCWERRRGTPLEAALTNFLLRIGPRRSLAADSLSRGDALTALERIGGAGLTEVVNAFLLAETRFGRYDALHKATRRADDETRRRLTCILDSQETWEGECVEQHEAAIALIELDDWPPMIRLLIREGLSSFRRLLDCVRDGYRPPPEALAAVRESVRTRGAAASPGQILAIGLGNHSDRELVRSMLASSDPESSVAHACLIALELLQDDVSESIPLLTRELSYKPHEFSATRALFVNGSPDAFAALAAHYGRQIPEGVAIRWIESNQGSKDVLIGVREAFATSESNPLDLWSPRLAVLLDQLSDDQAEFLLDDFRIRDRIRTEVFAATNPAALRCLGRIDRPQAIRVTRAALVSPDYREREQYAVVLLSLDASEAAWLIDQLAGESLSSVRDGVGRALTAVDIDPLLESLLAAPTSAQLQTACFAAGWAARGLAVSARLEQLVARGNDDVSRAAAEALERIRLRAAARELADAFLEEPTESRRWVLLDLLLAAADAGCPGHLWPLEGADIGHKLSPSQRRHVNDVLERRRRRLN